MATSEEMASIPKFCTNECFTAKYNFFTFLPLNLMIQLSKAANLYYLILTAL